MVAPPVIRKSAKWGEARAFMERSLEIETDECIIWPFGNSNGYARMWWVNKMTNVNRLICTKVYGAPPSDTHEAAHSCGNGQLGCINWKHLRWATKSENVMESRVGYQLAMSQRDLFS